MPMDKLQFREVARDEHMRAPGCVLTILGLLPGIWNYGRTNSRFFERLLSSGIRLGRSLRCMSSQISRVHFISHGFLMERSLLIGRFFRMRLVYMSRFDLWLNLAAEFGFPA